MDFDLNINGGKNKYLTLQGAGIDQTVIIDNVSKDPYPNISYLLRWTTVNAGLTRITGFTFQGGTNVDNLNSGMLYFRGNSHLFRFDHNKVIATTTSGIRTFGYLLGVLDHNTFDVSKSSLGLQLVHSTWSTPGTSYGDVSWALPDTLGTDQNLFVEDNVFTNDQSVRFFNYANDGYSGARVVFRKNTYINAVWANHGTDTGGRERSMRQFEVYDNTFKMDLQGNGFASVIGTRGGVGVVYNNTVTVSSGTLGTVFDLQYYRAVDDRNQQFGRCNGTNPWDENSLATGYRCLDQPGVGEGDLLSGAIPINTTTGRASTAHQVPNPNYAWNNTKNGALSQPISNVPSVVALGRDYLNQPRPGYTPYTYPHPLTTGSGTTNDPPSPPQNLNIQ